MTSEASGIERCENCCHFFFIRDFNFQITADNRGSVAPLELESGFCVAGNLKLLNWNLEVGQIELSLTSNSFQIMTRAGTGFGSGSKARDWFLDQSK